MSLWSTYPIKSPMPNITSLPKDQDQLTSDPQETLIEGSLRTHEIMTTHQLASKFANLLRYLPIKLLSIKNLERDGSHLQHWQLACTESVAFAPDMMAYLLPDVYPGAEGHK